MSAYSTCAANRKYSHGFRKCVTYPVLHGFIQTRYPCGVHEHNCPEHVVCFDSRTARKSQTSLAQDARSTYLYTDNSMPRCIYIEKHKRAHTDTSTPRNIVEPAACHIESCRHRGTVEDRGYLKRLNNGRRFSCTRHCVCACLKGPTMPVHPTSCKPSCIWHPASRAKTD